MGGEKQAVDEAQDRVRRGAIAHRPDCRPLAAELTSAPLTSLRSARDSTPLKTGLAMYIIVSDQQFIRERGNRLTQSRAIVVEGVSENARASDRRYSRIQPGS